ncbi:glycosyltransferase family 4 protein [Kiloniella sp.]|uniref:glycosyltransferase family 4 protein n=1 Tax=Kiloniella sp. TaxID=1938587 RepID=UPI003B021710
MKISFDQQVFLLQEYGGISRYFCSLAKELNQKSDLDTRVIAPLHFNRNLSTLKGVLGAGCLMPKLHPKLMRIAMETSKYAARYAIKKFAPDILHETYFTCDDYQPNGTKRVLTVYDFIHERYADLFEHSHMTSGPKKAAALRADHVISISESTRRDLIEYCGVPEDKISVTYLAADECFRLENIVSDPELKITAPYVLFVGSRGGYKNFEGLVQAFSCSSRLKADFDIICFGGGPLNKKEINLISECGLRSDQVIHIGGADSILAQLYRDAAAFVYPSMYEGFGIPPLEAMAAGCPVVSSNTSSLPEVVGQAGEYFDPNNSETMKEAMEHVLYSETRRKELITLGHRQEAKFSWEKCANETLTIYRNLI